MDEDLIGALIVAMVALFLGPLIWWMTARAADGALARNSFVGIRVRRTLESDEGWVEGHRAALPWARRTSLAAVLLGLVTIAVALSGPTQMAFGIAMAAMALIVAGAIMCAVAASRTAAD